MHCFVGLPTRLWKSPAELRNTANDQLIDTLIYVLTLSWHGGGVRYGTTPNRVIYLSRSFALMLISLPSERSIELSYRSHEGSLDIGNRHRLTTVTTIAVALGMTHSAEVLWAPRCIFCTRMERKICYLSPVLNSAHPYSHTHTHTQRVHSSRRRTCGLFAPAWFTLITSASAFTTCITFLPAWSAFPVYRQSPTLAGCATVEE